MDNSSDFKPITNAFMQNEPMQYGNLPQPLPENTKKNTKEISTNHSVIPSEQLAQKNNKWNLELLPSKWKDGGMDEQTKKHIKSI